MSYLYPNMFLCPYIPGNSQGELYPSSLKGPPLSAAATALARGSPGSGASPRHLVKHCHLLLADDVSLLLEAFGMSKLQDL